MKFVIPVLKLGDRVRAEVEDIPSANYVIVNFSGDLLRIANSTQQNFRLGQTLELEVTALSPLAFRLIR